MTDEALPRICETLRAGTRFLITSHARPDGDAIGSQVAMALALQALGKSVRIVNADPPPVPYAEFPGVSQIEVAPDVSGEFDAVLVMECSDLSRPGVAGLEGRFVINIDHHEGNTGYGSLNWFDGTAAACAEMVFDVIVALGVPMTPAIGSAIYLGILTDTGSFRHANITARTFDICRQVTAAGVEPARLARQALDSNTFGKLKLIGALLEGMDVAARGRLAVLDMDADLLATTGATYDDTDGVINLPLTAREVRAVIFFKRLQPGEVRVSLRSKEAIDVRSVARMYGGGGHRNASGFTIPGDLPPVRAQIIDRVTAAIEAVDDGGIPPDHDA
jgi:phosphoesterase RecJ-like protein